MLRVKAMTHKFKRYLRRFPMCSIDTETYGNIKEVSVHHPSIRLSHISWWNRGRGDVLDTKITDPDVVRAKAQEICGPDTLTVFWNASFDVPVLERFGVKVQAPYIDAMLLTQTVHPGLKKYGLKEMSRRFLHDPFMEEDALKAYMRRHKCSYGDVPLEHMYPYALKDAQNTWELAWLMLQALDKYDMWSTWQLECATLPYTLGMERMGITIDLDKTDELCHAATKEAASLRKRIVAELGPINVNSPVQLRKILYSDGRKPTRRTKTGQPSTDNLALLLDGRSVCRDIQKYRQYSKAIGTYYGAIRRRTYAGILNASLNQGQAITGRYSSSGPNLQNQPRPADTPLGRIRECYVAREGHLLVFIDFAQIEMRITASLASERHMLAAIQHGADLHTETCQRVFKKDDSDDDFKVYRYLSKRLNFATIYGTGGEKFANTVLEDSGGDIRIETWQASDYISKWWYAHPGVSNLKDRVLSEVAKTGGIRTVFGRYIPVASWKDHAALNYLVQGSAADVMKRAIVAASKVIKERRAKAKLLLTVHDELIFDIPRNEIRALVPALVRAMEDHTNFQVPLTCEVEIGQSWGTKRKVKLSSLQR